MPVEQTTIFFEDYFASDNPLDSYEPLFYDPPVIRGRSDHSLTVRRGEGPSGESCLRFLPPTDECPGCDACGTPSASCDFGVSLVRLRVEAPTPWYYVRSWIKIEGEIPPIAPGTKNWEFDETWPGPGNFPQHFSPLGILLPWPERLGDDVWSSDGVEILDYWPDVALIIGSFYVDYEPAVLVRSPGNLAVLFNLPGILPPNGSGYPWPNGEWVCAELGVGEITATSGKVRLFLQGKLAYETTWDYSGTFPFAGPGQPVGFAVGALPVLGPLGTPSPLNPFLGTFHWNVQLHERHPDRRWGLAASFARIATGDGPIGCLTRGGTPPDDPPPDPNALRCRDDDYDTHCDLAGECGRVIFETRGLTREAWETAGAGFPSEKSAWYRWVAPRDGRFIWRTRGSEVFNEVGVYRHTGATPPPLLPEGFSDEDLWDPTVSTSAAVEVEVEKGVEYRIRVASSSDGWIILDFGPAKPLVTDDGWSIDEGERPTRTRQVAVGPASGFAVQDAQIADDPSGSGTAPTMDPIRFGEVAV